MRPCGSAVIRATRRVPPSIAVSCTASSKCTILERARKVTRDGRSNSTMLNSTRPARSYSPTNADPSPSHRRSSASRTGPPAAFPVRYADRRGRRTHTRRGAGSSRSRPLRLPRRKSDRLHQSSFNVRDTRLSEYAEEWSAAPTKDQQSRLRQAAAIDAAALGAVRGAPMRSLGRLLADSRAAWCPAWPRASSFLRSICRKTSLSPGTPA
jgi:hypothetical protein